MIASSMSRIVQIISDSPRASLAASSQHQPIPGVLGHSGVLGSLGYTQSINSPTITMTSPTHTMAVGTGSILTSFLSCTPNHQSLTNLGNIIPLPPLQLLPMSLDLHISISISSSTSSNPFSYCPRYSHASSTSSALASFSSLASRAAAYFRPFRLFGLNGDFPNETLKKIRHVRNGCSNESMQPLPPHPMISLDQPIQQRRRIPVRRPHHS